MKSIKLELLTIIYREIVFQSIAHKNLLPDSLDSFNGINLFISYRLYTISRFVLKFRSKWANLTFSKNQKLHWLMGRTVQVDLLRQYDLWSPDCDPIFKLYGYRTTVHLIPSTLMNEKCLPVIWMTINAINFNLIKTLNWDLKLWKSYTVWKSTQIP